MASNTYVIYGIKYICIYIHIWHQIYMFIYVHMCVRVCVCMAWVWAGSGVGDRQGNLECCSPWSHKESDTAEQLNWTDGKSTGMGCHSLLWWLFLTQGLNPGLPHCGQTLYHLSHQGSPWVCLCIFVCICIYWRRKWQLTPVYLSGESYEEWSLEGFSPWGHKESEVTEVT